MKKLLFIVTFALLISLFGCKEESIGPGNTPFMEKLTATLPAEGGEEVLKAKSFFFSIQYIVSIQSGDTIKQDFAGIGTGQQTISREWFKVETIGDGEDSYPTEIKVSVQANSTSEERQLTFGVWNGEREDKITITQN